MNHDPLASWIDHRRRNVGQDSLEEFTDTVMSAIKSQHQPESQSHIESDSSSRRSSNPFLSAVCIIAGGVKVWIALELAI